MRNKTILILICVCLLASCSLFQKEPDPSELYTPTPVPTNTPLPEPVVMITEVPDPTAAAEKFLKAWQERKKDTITHPFLREKLPWGLVPFVQALLLARFLRGDLDAYPPFLWK